MNQRRPAFTLIEMLVALALTLFIMVIISQAFVTALETFRQLKGIGDMQSNLRTAATLLQSDLAQDHFDAKKRLSDANFTSDRPREGFFAVRLGKYTGGVDFKNGGVSEGSDADGMSCFRGPVPGNKADALYFTIKMRGNRRENFFSHRFPAAPTPAPNNPPAFPPFFGGPLPFFGLSPLTDPMYPRVGAAAPAIGLPNFFNQPPDVIFQDDGQQLTYTSQWAEVVWYLVRTGSTDEQSVPGSTLGTPLWGLYRAQYLLVPNNAAANANYDPKDSTGAAVPAPFFATLQETTHSKYLAAYGGVSCFANQNLPGAFKGQYLYFNSPADVTNSNFRAITARSDNIDGPYPSLAGNSSLVLSNVVSFHVRLMPVGGGDFTGDYATAEPVADFTVASKTVESATTTTGISAIQIIIRVWDPASQQSRQITIVQDM
jgi:prepilin-type N-terminal cleavage/methylation domain-containing protein